MTILISVLLALVTLGYITYPFVRRPQAPAAKGESAGDTGFCPQCGAARRQGDLFCPRCGTSFQRNNEE